MKKTLINIWAYDHHAVFTIEHSFTINELEIDKLMYANNYLRIFKNLTLFDAWYVKKKGIRFYLKLNIIISWLN